VPQKIGVNIFGNVSCDVRIRLFDPRKPAIHSAATGHFQPNRAGVLELQVGVLYVKFRPLVILIAKPANDIRGISFHVILFVA
jgi:hypothetical protein